MVQISGANERFLQTPVALSEIMRVMEPDLVFLDKVPFVDSGGETPTYYSKGNKSADKKKQTPAMKTPSSRFPEVEISRMTKTSAVLNEEGLAVRLDKDAIKKKSGIDMIMDAYQTVGYWMAEYLNSAVYTKLRAGGTDAGVVMTDWGNTANATPITDARKFKNSMKREGYPYRLTDAFVEMVNFNEMEGFLHESEIQQFRDAAMNAEYSQIILPMEGKPTLVGLQSGITHGDILGIDRFHPAASVFYNNDPQFSTAQISYETMVNGQPSIKTVPNFGLSMHQYFEDDTHDTVLQFWFDQVTVVKDPYGILYDNGL